LQQARVEMLAVDAAADGVVDAGTQRFEALHPACFAADAFGTAA